MKNVNVQKLIHREALPVEDSEPLKTLSHNDVFPSDSQIEEASRFFSKVFAKDYKRIIMTNADEKRAKKSDFYCIEITRERICVTTVKSIYKNKMEFEFESKNLIQDGHSVGPSGWTIFKLSLKQVSEDLKHHRVFSFKEKS